MTITELGKRRLQEQKELEEKIQFFNENEHRVAITLIAKNPEHVKALDEALEREWERAKEERRKKAEQQRVKREERKAKRAEQERQKREAKQRQVHQQHQG